MIDDSTEKEQVHFAQGRWVLCISAVISTAVLFATPVLSVVCELKLHHPRLRDVQKKKQTKKIIILSKMYEYHVNLGRVVNLRAGEKLTETGPSIFCYLGS